MTNAEITQIASSAGIDYIGFAPVARWDADTTAGAVSPCVLFPEAQTVIVLGAPLWLPILEASPSVLGREQMFVTDKLLEKAAYRIGIALSRARHRVYNVAKYTEKGDGFFLPVAGFYAGLGTLGQNNRLLTRDYGCRFNLKAIFTDAVLDSSPPVRENLCVGCGNCRKACPAGAIHETGAFDSALCHAYKRNMDEQCCDCSFCIRVCPVGSDRVLFAAALPEKLLNEKTGIKENPADSDYKRWQHIRSYGGVSPMPEYANNTGREKC